MILKLHGLKATIMTGLIAAALGCNLDGGGSSGGSPLVGPDLRGSWSGFSGVTSSSAKTPVKATVKQKEDMVTITTTLPKDGTGSQFTGTINGDGDMVLTDAFDGETWTTYKGPANSSSIRIFDLTCPGCGDLFFLELSR